MRITLSVVRLFSVPIFLMVALSLAGPVAAQVQIPQDALATVSNLDEIIRQGSQLEQTRQWNDAVQYYERALRTFPQRPELQERVKAARVHIDLARRYADHSYLASIDRLSQQQALDLYSEVLLKIDTYHVNQPEWGELVREGILHLELAVTEPAFVDHFPQPVAANASQTLYQQLDRAIDFRRIHDRNQAYQAAAQAAQMAAQYLRIPPQATVLEFTCAAASSLDAYSAYLSGNQLDEVFSQIEGNFVGLGIELKADDHSLLIVNVIPGGPAEEAGIRANDRIIEIDGKPTREVSADAAADLLKGEDQSFVVLAVQGVDGSQRRLRVQRRRVDVPSVQDVKILDPENGIAYLKLTSFQKNTSREVDNALWSLHRQGMRTLVIDVRGNPGGLLNASVELADKFLSSGAIVSTRGRSVREDFDYTAHQVGTWRVPLFVLIDGDSASASEIFAGAIHDHHRGSVVGQRSYGKGSVQGIFPLTRFKAGIRLTTAKFFSPSGQAISHHGVTPDILVHTTAKPQTSAGQAVPTPEDATLNTALNLARKSSGYQVRRAG